VVDPVWRARRRRRHGSILHWWHHPPPRNPTAITIQDYLKIKSILKLVVPREMENISRGPNFGDFVTILTEGSMQDNTVARV
jgi:hypothetical protein